MISESLEVLNERQVADWLGLSCPTLVRHRRDGTGPKFIRLSPRRIAYRRMSVEEWLKERERNTVNSAESFARANIGPTGARHDHRGR